MGGLIFIDLEFDTPDGGAPLGDIASSLVNLHDLLRDLAAMAADPFSAEFREIQVVAIEMRRPLTIKLSLRAISMEAVKAFQDICRDVILFRGEPVTGRQLATINSALELALRAHGKDSTLSPQETQRVFGHIEALQNAEMPLKRVVVKEAQS